MKTLQQESRLRINKEERFASTPTEYLALHLKVFMNYVCNNLQYNSQDASILKDIFLMYINEGNILHYINRSAPAIYKAIISDNLADLADYKESNEEIIVLEY